MPRPRVRLPREPTREAAVWDGALSACRRRSGAGSPGVRWNPRLPVCAPLAVGKKRPISMDQPSDQTAFVYVNYIKATPEQVWQGLTDPAFTTRYWRHRRAGGKAFPSDWKKGSTWDLVHEEVGLVVSDPAQVILESDPHARLAYTWHTFTPEWAAKVGMDDATLATWQAEPRSRVAYDIEDISNGAVKLTVTHDGFPPGSAVLPAISEGWPAVMSSLKTLLETGSTLHTA